MSWNNLNSQYDDKDMPRRLTEADMNFVVEYLPLAPAADLESAQLCRRQIMTDLRSILETEDVAPSVIEELAQRIVQYHNSSLITPGTPVGFAAGESVGAAATQSTLNTFHSSGSASSISYTINSLKDIITATMNPKMQRCIVHYENKSLSYVDVLNSRSYIVGSVVSDFVVRYDIARLDQLPSYWWNEQGFEFYEKPAVTATKIMRLHLNVAEMYKHRVTIKDIATALENEITYKPEKKEKSEQEPENPEEEEPRQSKKKTTGTKKKDKEGKTENTITALYGSLTEGIIDLYQTTEGKMKYHARLGDVFTEEFIEQSFFETIVRLELPNIKVKGVSDLKNLTPIIIPVWSMVSAEARVTESDLPTDEREKYLPFLNDLWFLFYDESIMKINGIESSNLAQLCYMAGITDVRDNDTRMMIRLPTQDKYRYRSTYGDFCILLGTVYYRYVKDLQETEDGYAYSISSETIRENNKGSGNGSKRSDTFRITLSKDKFEDVPAAEILNVDGKYFRLVPEEDVVAFEDEFFIRVKPDVKVDSLSPAEFIKAKISAEKLSREQETKDNIDQLLEQTKDMDREERRRILSQPVVLPPSDLLKAAQFVIAQVEGANLKELLALERIDKRRTTCDNVHVLAETLGIEATRSFIIRAMTNTIGSSSQVHPANIFLIAEFIVSRGYPRGATFAGIARQPGGHLSLASLQKAGAVFTKSALQGKEEDIRGVSASIAVGARFALGDGSFDIGQDVIVQGKNVTLINEDLFDLNQLRESGTTKPKVKVEELINDLDSIDMAAARGGFDYKEGEDDTSLLHLYEYVNQDITTRGSSVPLPVIEPPTGTEQVVFGAAVAQTIVAEVDRLDQRALIIPTRSSGLVYEASDEVEDYTGEIMPASLTNFLQQLQRQVSEPAPLPPVPRLSSGFSNSSYLAEIAQQRRQQSQSPNASRPRFGSDMM